MERTFLKIIKGIYKKLTGNTIPNNERFKEIHLSTGRRQGSTLLPLLLEHSAGYLSPFNVKASVRLHQVCELEISYQQNPKSINDIILVFPY